MVTTITDWIVFLACSALIGLGIAALVIGLVKLTEFA